MVISEENVSKSDRRGYGKSGISVGEDMRGKLKREAVSARSLGTKEQAHHIDHNF